MYGYEKNTGDTFLELGILITNNSDSELFLWFWLLKTVSSNDPNSWPRKRFVFEKTEKQTTTNNLAITLQIEPFPLILNFITFD